MTFAAPIWLVITGVLIFVLICLFSFGLRQRGKLLARFAAERLLPYLTEQASIKRIITKGTLIVLALSAIGIALSRPQYGIEWTERKARGLDIVFVLDSSKSMLASDLRPNRLERAKLAVLDLVGRLDSDRIGLVVFAGNAFLQTPPTLDYAAFRESLNNVDPDVMTRGGSDLGNAIEEAAKAFPAQDNIKVVVLLTDGQDLGGTTLKAAKSVSEDGIKIYAIGIGTPAGEYLKIPNADGSERFVRNAEGKPVRSQLDESTLQEIAQITQGRYSRLSDQSLDQLFTSVIANLPRTERESEMQEVRIERFQWALAAAFLLLALELCLARRKLHRQSVSTLTICLIVIPLDGQAQVNQIVDSKSNTQVTDMLEQDYEPDEIGTQASNPREIYNQAYDAFSRGDYEVAHSNYAQAIRDSSDLNLQRDAIYNMGHSAYQIGEAAFQEQDFAKAIEQWNSAEALFKSSAQIDPSDTNAKQDAEQVAKRRQALEELIEKQEQQQDPQQESDKSNEEDSEQSENEDSSKQEQNQESSDQQSDTHNQEKSRSSRDNQSDQEHGQDPEEQTENSETNEQSQSGNSEDDPQSSQNPMEDMPQDNQVEQTERADASPDSTSLDAPTDEPSTNEPIQGMRLSEAQDLLDSLRERERLLPYTETTPSQQRDQRDW
ncbi:MAG: VWA domain-containing protein [Verrucomicrobiota bacterium]|nr:VWA domain-containing protein [Verrucomicrobiota bacterium]